MEGLLDSIIDSHGGARVIREQNDLGGINIGTTFDADMNAQIDNIMNGPFDACEMGISREQAVARLKASDTPAKRAAWLEDMKVRAVRRAGLDVSRGKVAMFSGSGIVPWHGLGKVVKGAATSAEAIMLAEQDFEVDKVPMEYSWNGQTHKVNDAYALVRKDTGAKLNRGTVGGRYTVIQNEDAFKFLDGVLDDFGAEYETAGSLYGGTKIWILAHMPHQDFQINGGDVVESYCLFTNPHDGSGMAYCYPTTVRVVCANTQRMSLKDRDKGLGIRHTGDIMSKLKRTREVLGLAKQSFDEFKEVAEAMHEHRREPAPYLNGVLDRILDIQESHAKMTQHEIVEDWVGKKILDSMVLTNTDAKNAAYRKVEKELEKRRSVLSDILDIYEKEAHIMPGIRGTLWGAFNAFTNRADHHQGRRQSGDKVTKLSRRFESVIDGERDGDKQVAYEYAKEVMAV